MLKIKYLIKNLLLLFITLIFCIILLELSIRFFFPSPPPYPDNFFIEDNYVCYKMKPNFKTISIQPEFKIKIETNSRGMRDYQYNANPHDNFIILGLGDSFTFGQGVELEETFTKLLELKINKNYAKTQVINAGNAGYGAYNYLNLLKYYLTDYKPNIILVNLYLGNDFMDNIFGCETSFLKGKLVSHKEIKLNVFTKIKIFISKYSQAFRFFNPKLTRIIISIKGDYNVPFCLLQLSEYNNQYLEDMWNLTKKKTQRNKNNIRL